MRSLAACLLLVAACAAAAGESHMDHALLAMPPGFHLQEFDDCGAPGRQPHVRTINAHAYSPAEVPGDEKARTVAWDWRNVEVAYEGLRTARRYVVAVTYANEAFNARVQSLWAGDTRLHAPHPLPRGGSERLLFAIPPETVRDGRLVLSCRLEGPVNVVVSAVELWADAPSPEVLRLGGLAGLLGDLEGRALDLAWDPAPGAEVTLRAAGAAAPLATARAGADGGFRFPRSVFARAAREAGVEVEARRGATRATAALGPDALRFEPPRFRPMPRRVAGLRQASHTLDGVWRLRADAPETARAARLDAPEWKPFRVPGQWVQQGFDLPPDRPVSVVRSFEPPAAWKGRRVFLRFDAIHAGTRYWLNGVYLGRSENLFTPVEWEVTRAIRPGEPNRIDLEMMVDTPSERLSDSSGYAFHNLGGIDRSVHLFALPRLHVGALRLQAGLDGNGADGLLRAEAVLDLDGESAEDVALRVAVLEPGGRAVPGASGEARLSAVTAGESRATVALRAAGIRPWSAEKPALYRVAIELLERGKLLERVEREVGFRTVEVRGAQLYVNGRPVKLAGACRHETDPLTGRADTARRAEQDVRLLKDANLNYIRCVHYPPTEELVEAADRIGMYLEVEAPFCWVAPDETLRDLRAVLTPTAAMVDYFHSHPSVIIWSLANESTFNPCFELSNALVKKLDPTRPTTFNNPDPKRVCDIANLHYAPTPYDAQLPDDPRPVLLGEYFYPICHEQTDARIDPGLRELWGAGHSDPTGDWGRRCAVGYGQHAMQPGLPPGTWSDMVRSGRVIGGAIWAALDAPFYLPGGRKVGYAWHHGFWGLIDAWRRPKPESWLARLIFSPAWFPDRRPEWSPGRPSARLRVENRYSFTDLAELRFTWRVGRASGRVGVRAAPGEVGALEIPLPTGTRPGTPLRVEARDVAGRLVNVLATTLGEAPPAPDPRPAGPPALSEEGGRLVVTGDGFRLAIDRAAGALLTGGESWPDALRSLPMPHVTRFDFGDLAPPGALPYAVLPEMATRVVEGVDARETPEGVRIEVRDRYDGFRGRVLWTVDRKGRGWAEYDYERTGPDLAVREVGVRVLLAPGCQTLRWKRWSEWGAYPPDSISRVEGTARAHRAPGRPPVSEETPPAWPWALDETEMGTRDFRGVKLNVYRAGLEDPRGAGLRLRAHADAHARATLAPEGVWLHLLAECRLGPVTVRTGERLRGRLALDLLPGRR